MADQPQVSPGAETSEYKLTKVMILVGVALQGLAGVLAQIPQTSTAVVIGAALCGTAVQILTVLGYIKGRTAVKTEALASAAAAVLPPAPPPSPQP